MRHSDGDFELKVPSRRVDSGGSVPPLARTSSIALPVQTGYYLLNTGS